MPKKPENIKRSWVPERTPFSRPKDYSWFYNQTKWRKFSLSYREKFPVCVECKKNSIVSPAQVCDHIDGIESILKQNRNPFEEKECQSLCNECHNSKSGREAHRNKIIRG
jgi:5-methylcytosine-specific restriction enzyme A